MSQGWTIAESATGEYREKGSSFYAYAYPVKELADIEKYLNHLRKSHPKARHVCYAYVLGLKQPKEKTNDDGEPANTGGAPILNHIHGLQLTNVLVAVVRYFGGTLLGKGGLIRAYGTAARDALEKVEFVQDFEITTLWVEVPYEQMEPVMQIVKKHQLQIQERIWDSICKLLIEVEKDQSAEISALFENIDQVKIHEKA